MNKTSLKPLLAIAASALSFTASATTIVSSPASLVLGPNSSDSRGLVQIAPESSDLFVRFDMLFSGVVSRGDFAVFWFDDAKTGNHENRPNIGMKADFGAGNADFFTRISNGSLPAFDTAPVVQATSGVSVNLFGHLFKTAGSSTYNRFDMWINSALSSEELLLTTPDAVATGTTTLSAVSYMAFRNVSLTSPDQVTISNLVVSNSVPEPGSFALLTLALLGLPLVARRRNS